MTQSIEFISIWIIPWIPGTVAGDDDRGFEKVKPDSSESEPKDDEIRVFETPKSTMESRCI